MLLLSIIEQFCFCSLIRFSLLSNWIAGLFFYNNFIGPGIPLQSTTKNENVNDNTSRAYNVIEEIEESSM
jgi:hypothetical protein